MEHHARKCRGKLFHTGAGALLACVLVAGAAVGDSASPRRAAPAAEPKHATYRAAAASPMRDGRLVVTGQSRSTYAWRMVQVYADGRFPRSKSFGEWNPLAPEYSPDGSKVAFQLGGPGVQPDIMVMKVDGTGLRRLTTSGHYDGQATWSPDGRRIAFVSTRNTSYANLWVMNADGTDQHIVAGAGPHVMDVVWSPTGRLVYESYYDQDRYETMEMLDLYSIRPDGTGRRRLSDTPEGWERDPAVSPDGRIAYTHVAPSDYHHVMLWVMNADGSDKHKVVDDAKNPAWSPDGRRLVFVDRASGQWPTLGFVRPDGTGRRTQRLAVAEGSDLGLDPILAWQPWPGTRPSQVRVTDIDRSGTQMVVRGRVDQASPYYRVELRLLRLRSDGSRKLVASSGRLTGARRQYRFELARPARGTCVVRVRYTGDHGHLASTTNRRTRC
ncbi:MAG TPA: hypothetical protein VLA97_14925 [Nocardioidaceae bacterium]|nr:hypothetical protein [Nocardioidaceae bacterium]